MERGQDLSLARRPRPPSRNRTRSGREGSSSRTNRVRGRPGSKPPRAGSCRGRPSSPADSPPSRGEIATTEGSARAIASATHLLQGRDDFDGRGLRGGLRAPGRAGSSQGELQAGQPEEQVIGESFLRGRSDSDSSFPLPGSGSNPRLRRRPGHSAKDDAARAPARLEARPHRRGS